MNDHKLIRWFMLCLLIGSFVLALIPDLIFGLLGFTAEYARPVQLASVVLATMSISIFLYERYLRTIAIKPLDLRIRNELEEFKLLQFAGEIQYQNLNNNIEKAITTRRIDFDNGRQILEFLEELLPQIKRRRCSHVISMTNLLLPGRSAYEVRENIFNTASSIQEAWDAHLLRTPDSQRWFIIDSEVKGQAYFDEFMQHIQRNHTDQSYKFVTKESSPQEVQRILNTELHHDFILFYAGSTLAGLIRGASSEKIRVNFFDAFFTHGESGDTVAFARRFEAIERYVQHG